MGSKVQAFGAAACLVLFLVLMTVAAPPAAPPEPIQKCIDRGVRYLKSQQDPMAGTWPYAVGQQQQTGATALAALTLLECDVPARDPAIQKAAAYLRREGPGLTTTYALSLAILFFDRLADPGDVPLLQVMAVRLLAGQSEATGGWGYNCPLVGGEAEMRQLAELIKLRTQAAPRQPGQNPPPAPQATRDVHKEIQDHLARLIRNALPQVGVDSLVAMGDNSNTQFALLALWVARRHGIPADLALERVEARFRLTQNADGGWGYLRNMSSTPAMTCAGLLGVAVGHGVANERTAASAAKGDSKQNTGRPKARRRDPARDLSVRRGLLALGTAIGVPLPGRALEQTLLMKQMAKGHYFLWSLERVAVAYGLDTIGRKDWYAWGAQLLMASQEPNGSWQGEYAQGGVDTCFALLFLRRANLAMDLTASLKGRVQDPGEVLLKAGGVGGASLMEKGLTSAVEMKETSSTSAPQPDPAPAARPSESGKPSPAQELRAQLVRAAASLRPALLAQLREGKGSEYTQALAEAIPQLAGPAHLQARDALAERLARMTAATLRDKLKEENLEIRRAAALACVMREEKRCVPDLIPLLKDPEATVGRAAHVALKELTGQDFGPAAEATAAERERAIIRWKVWWAREGGM